jgi:hypothetical protein
MEDYTLLNERTLPSLFKAPQSAIQSDGRYLIRHGAKLDQGGFSDSVNLHLAASPGSGSGRQQQFVPCGFAKYFPIEGKAAEIKLSRKMQP